MEEGPPYRWRRVLHTGGGGSSIQVEKGKMEEGPPPRWRRVLHPDGGGYICKKAHKLHYYLKSSIQMEEGPISLNRSPRGAFGLVFSVNLESCWSQFGINFGFISGVNFGVG